MATTTDIIERLQGMNLQELLTESILETAEQYVDLNTAQLYQGKDGDGQPISPQYAWDTYAAEKNQMNPTPGYGIPDLKLTGAFYRGYTLQVEGDEVIKDSDVEYADDLFTKYGNQIGELDEVNHDEYVNGEMAPVFYDKVRELTGLL